MKIAVITPVKHLEGIEKLLATKGNVVYYETASKLEVKKALLKHQIDTILCIHLIKKVTVNILKNVLSF